MNQIQSSNWEAALALVMCLLLISRIAVSMTPHIHYAFTKRKFHYIYVGNINCKQYGYQRRFVPEAEAETEKFWERMFTEEGGGMDFYTTIISLVLTNEFTVLYSQWGSIAMSLLLLLTNIQTVRHLEIIQIGATHQDFHYKNFTAWLQGVVLAVFNIVQLKDCESFFVTYLGYAVTAYCLVFITFHSIWSPFTIGLRWQLLSNVKSHKFFRWIQCFQFLLNSTALTIFSIFIMADFLIVNQLRTDLQLQFWQLGKPLKNNMYQNALLDQQSLTDMCTSTYNVESLDLSFSSIDQFVGGISFDGNVIYKSKNNTGFTSFLKSTQLDCFTDKNYRFNFQCTFLPAQPITWLADKSQIDFDLNKTQALTWGAAARQIKFASDSFVAVTKNQWDQKQLSVQEQVTSCIQKCIPGSLSNCHFNTEECGQYTLRDRTVRIVNSVFMEQVLPNYKIQIYATDNITATNIARGHTVLMIPIPNNEGAVLVIALMSFTRIKDVSDCFKSSWYIHTGSFKEILYAHPQYIRPQLVSIVMSEVRILQSQFVSTVLDILAFITALMMLSLTLLTLVQFLEQYQKTNKQILSYSEVIITSPIECFDEPMQSIDKIVQPIYKPKKQGEYFHNPVLARQNTAWNQQSISSKGGHSLGQKSSNQEYQFGTEVVFDRPSLQFSTSSNNIPFYARTASFLQSSTNGSQHPSGINYNYSSTTNSKSSKSKSSETKRALSAEVDINGKTKQQVLDSSQYVASQFNSKTDINTLSRQSTQPPLHPKLAAEREIIDSFHEFRNFELHGISERADEENSRLYTIQTAQETGNDSYANEHSKVESIEPVNSKSFRQLSKKEELNV